MKAFWLKSAPAEVEEEVVETVEEKSQPASGNLAAELREIAAAAQRQTIVNSFNEHLEKIKNEAHWGKTQYQIIDITSQEEMDYYIRGFKNLGFEVDVMERIRMASGFQGIIISW